MTGRLVKWIVPGMVTVVVGTAAALATTGERVAADLLARAELATRAYGWAKVTVSGRDAVLSGTATEPSEVASAVATLSGLGGIRSVTSAVVMAPLASPYPFAVSVADGVVDVAGGTPDARLVAAIAAEARATTTELEVMSGAPERPRWRAAVSFALTIAGLFDRGRVELADLALSAEGRAKSFEAFDVLARIAGAVPAGIEVASLAVAPPVVSPYILSASLDGGNLAIEGYAPSAEAIDALRAAAAPLAVEASLRLASGEPKGFLDRAARLLKSLVRLDYGTATLRDGVSALVGAPPTAEVAQAVTEELKGAGSIVTLEPPRASPYWFGAVLANGTVTLDGYVPDPAMRERFAAGGADATSLDVARGQPEVFEPAVDFGIALLARLSEGRFTLRENVVSLKGRARTSDDLAAVEALLAEGAPGGTLLAMAEVRPPFADPFTWSATRTEDGRVALAGNVPDKAARSRLAAAAGSVAADATELADGTPPGFADAAAAGLGILALLDTGVVTFDGASWGLTGLVATPQAAFEAESAFRLAGLREAGWTYDVRMPAPPPAEAPPAVADYAWSAEKLPAGTVALKGYVPTAGAQRYLAIHAGARVVDTMMLGSGAPAGFIAAAVAGLDALLLLDDGKLAYADGGWTLTGRTESPDIPARIGTQLAQATGTDGWAISIKALSPPPSLADPYRWSAAKAADGTFTLSGNLPNDGLRRYVVVHAGKVASDTTAIASGAPEGFVADLLAALAALDRLAEGTVGYDGATWYLAGTPGTSADREAALAALSAARTLPGLWRTDVALPPAAPPPAPAVVEAKPVEQVEAAEAPGLQVAADAGAAAAPAVEPEAAVEAQSLAAGEPQPSATDAAATEAETALAAVEAPAGVPPSDAAALGPPLFSATRAEGGPIVLTGIVPAEPARRWFGMIAGDVPTDALSLADSLPEGFIPNADAGIRALSGLSAGALAFDGSRWSLSGTADTDAQRQGILAVIEGVPDAAGWVIEIGLTPAIALCRRQVASFEASHRILFQSGKAKMTDESAASLAQLAQDLAQCPEAGVEVEGHTDADGPEERNLALSVARAEAVVDALIGLGIAPERLYAVGYGESMPVASNDTNVGKQANRRIVFTLVEGR